MVAVCQSFYHTNCCFNFVERQVAELCPDAATIIVSDCAITYVYQVFRTGNQFAEITAKLSPHSPAGAVP